MEKIDRRLFVTSACAACALAATGRVSAALDDAKVHAVGTLADYPKDGIYDAFARRQRFFLVREGGRLYAVSALCTHKAYLLRFDKDQDELQCPGHQSRFDEKGRVLNGPADMALPRHKISADAGGKLTVDRNVEFFEDQWDEAGAFVAVT
ncbi:MAG: ubiquinol-cytochrome c reductase iron-sulfur subunit [Phycisphaerae bacterium]